MAVPTTAMLAWGSPPRRVRPEAQARRERKAGMAVPKTAMLAWGSPPRRVRPEGAGAKRAEGWHGRPNDGLSGAGLPSWREVILFLAGQGPYDASGNRAGPTVAEQVRQVLGNLDGVARAAGGSLQNAVRVGMYLGAAV